MTVKPFELGFRADALLICLQSVEYQNYSPIHRVKRELLWSMLRCFATTDTTIASDTCIPGYRQRLRGVQAYAAPTQRRDVPWGESSLRPRAEDRLTTTMLSSPALGLNRRRCSVRLRVPPFANRTFDRSRLSQLGFPRGNVCSGIVCDRVRRRLHRTPRFPCHASTSVRVRDSAARIVVARQRRERSRTRLPTTVSTTRIVASTILPRRSTRFCNVILGRKLHDPFAFSVVMG